MNPMDITSHESLLDVRKSQEQIHIIGCGAIGSHIALSLAKLGFENLILFDFDQVESHNIANQAYHWPHVDLPKVEALRAVLQVQTGLELPAHNVVDKRVDAKERLNGIVFLCVDSMAARKEIFNGCCKLKPAVNLMIDVRMNPWDGRVYIINPGNIEHCTFWESNSDYTDENANVPRSACGRNISVGPTAIIIAEMAVIQFMRWCRHTRMQEDLDIPIEKELFIGMNNWLLTSC